MTEFLARLKQRKLVQWALAYIAAAFALIQVLDVVASRFNWPAPLERSIILALAVGFIVALVIAWYHGEKGRQRVSGPELLLLALVLAIGGGAVWFFARSGVQPAAMPTVAGPPAKPLIASPVTGPVQSSSSAPRFTAAQGIPAKSIAVLPLVNESGDKDQQYFSDGLSEDLITALSQFSGLKVINRDSSFRFRNSKDSVQEVGEKLGVAHLLEGSVQRLGGEVRISAELVNCSDGSTLWSEHYDRPYQDLFALQDDITKAVADALKAKLLDSSNDAVVQSDRPPSGNLAAYSAFLQGKFYVQLYTEVGQRKAIGYFTDATRLDPNYALAWAYLGDTQTTLAGNFLGGEEAVKSWAEGRASVQHALQLDPNLAAAHAAYVFILSSADHDWTGAAAEAERAYQLAPNKGYFELARMQAALGHAQQAVDVMRHGLLTDPLCTVCYSYLAAYLPGLDHLDAAAGAAGKMLQLDPTYYFGLYQLAYVDMMRGDATAAMQSAQQAPPGIWRDAAMAVALQIGGNRVAANAALQTMIAKQAGYAAYQIAEIYALRRDPDDMFKWLERASRNHDPGIALMLTDPPILRYRDDPRFAAFCKKVGLPTTTDAKALP